MAARTGRRDPRGSPQHCLQAATRAAGRAQARRRRTLDLRSRPPCGAAARLPARAGIERPARHQASLSEAECARGPRSMRLRARAHRCRMRSTMEKKPFERCGVRCSLSPSSANTACASVRRMSSARLAVEQREQHGDQPAHDMGIAVALEVAERAGHPPRCGGRAGEPDLAGAAAHLVGVGAQRSRAGAPGRARARSDSGSGPPSRRAAQSPSGCLRSTWSTVSSQQLSRTGARPDAGERSPPSAFILSIWSQALRAQGVRREAAAASRHGPIRCLSAAPTGRARPAACPPANRVPRGRCCWRWCCAWAAGDASGPGVRWS